MKNAWSFLFYITSQNGPLMSETVAKLLVDQERTIQVYTDTGFFSAKLLVDEENTFQVFTHPSFFNSFLPRKDIAPGVKYERGKGKNWNQKKPFSSSTFFFFNCFWRREGSLVKETSFSNLVCGSMRTPGRGISPPLVLKPFQRKINRNHVTFLYLAVEIEVFLKCHLQRTIYFP